MKSETLIARVPPRIASWVKAQAQKRRLSTSRYIGRLIEKDIKDEKEIDEEDEDETITYTYEDLQREVREAKAEIKEGKLKAYTSAKELLHDLKRDAQNTYV
jgi:soluble cytochrome b562